MGGERAGMARERTAVRKRKGQYHHGDLRRALLDAGLDVLREDGAAALTLREVARRAGVTHAAPYRHFPSKEALLAAIAEEGFRMLAQVIAENGCEVADESQRMTRLGAGYVRFALKYPEHLRLMFSSGLDASAFPSLQEAADATFGLLVEAVAAGQKAGTIRGDEPIQVAMTCWSMVHGFSLLLLDHSLEHIGVTQKNAVATIEKSSALLFEGLRRR